MGVIDTDEIQARLKHKEVQSKRRMLGFTAIPVLITVLLVYYSTSSVNNAQKQLQGIRAETDSMKILRDRYQLEYLEADGLLKTLLPAGKIDSNLRIRYYKKKLDQDKAILSLQDLGYRYFVEEPLEKAPLKEIETNGIYYGRDVSPYDIKIICLSLIRAGFKIRAIKAFNNNTGRENMVQIVGVALQVNGRLVPVSKTPISANTIYQAVSIKELVY